MMQHYLNPKKIIHTPPKTSGATFKEMIYNQLCHGLQELPNTIAYLKAFKYHSVFT